MPTLYVENVPEDLYEALRSKAQQNRRSITAEVLTLLAENVPTAAELARRRQLLDKALNLQSKVVAEKFPTTEEMQRESRQR
jgi:plasmid stability protein